MTLISVADQATSEMNRKEKDIIRAYLRAIRYASHLESRIRIVLVGDTGTGEWVYTHAQCVFEPLFCCSFISRTHSINKCLIGPYYPQFFCAEHKSLCDLEVYVLMTYYYSSHHAGKSALKKTVYGEWYDPRHKPTLGIDADPSITRITFKQYKEWVLQNASKADTRRLNLEYIDIIIDYVLNALQQPWVSDDAFDIGNLQIAKGRVPTVGFNPSETVIPESLVESETVTEKEGRERGEGAGEDTGQEEVVEGDDGRSSSQGGLGVMEGETADRVRRKRANPSDGDSHVRPPTPPSETTSSSSVLPGSTSSIESTSTSSRVRPKSGRPNNSSDDSLRRPRRSRLHPPSTLPASSSIESTSGSGRSQTKVDTCEPQ